METKTIIPSASSTIVENPSVVATPISEMEEVTNAQSVNLEDVDDSAIPVVSLNDLEPADLEPEKEEDIEEVEDEEEEDIEEEDEDDDDSYDDGSSDDDEPSDDEEDDDEQEDEDIEDEEEEEEDEQEDDDEDADMDDDIDAYGENSNPVYDTYGDNFAVYLKASNSADAKSVLSEVVTKWDANKSSLIDSMADAIAQGTFDVHYVESADGIFDFRIFDPQRQFIGSLAKDVDHPGYTHWMCGKCETYFYMQTAGIKKGDIERIVAEDDKTTVDAIYDNYPDSAEDLIKQYNA